MIGIATSLFRVFKSLLEEKREPTVNIMPVNNLQTNNYSNKNNKPSFGMRFWGGTEGTINSKLISIKAHKALQNLVANEDNHLLMLNQDKYSGKILGFRIEKEMFSVDVMSDDFCSVVFSKIVSPSKLHKTLKYLASAPFKRKANEIYDQDMALKEERKNLIEHCSIISSLDSRNSLT